MARGRKIIGYGICGPGEAGRFMRETLEEFKRLCDETVIMLNGATLTELQPEIALLKEYGIPYRHDQREWGRMQWKIKEDFLSFHISKLALEGDVMVCLDMDERFDRHMSREWLLAMPFDAYKVFIVDLWNDPEHYKPESCFWNTRIWRWTGNIEWIRKPVHCGLAPRWAVAYNRYAPFLLIHKGLMLRATRQRKIERYEKYDPNARHLGKPYYAMLHSDTAEPFDEERLHSTIENEVATYKQTKPRSLPLMANPKGRFAYVRNPGGMTVDIPEKQLAETLKRGGFTFLGWADEADKEMEEMFAEEEAENTSPNPGAAPVDASGQARREGSYQRPMADEAAELAMLNGRDLPPAAGETVVTENVTMRNRVGLKEREQIRKTAQGRAPAKKKAVKKATKKAVKKAAKK